MSLTRLHPLKSLAILLAILGFSLLFYSRQSTLSCLRAGSRVDCTKSDKLSLGLWQLSTIQLSDVQAVKLDTKIKRSREANDEYGTKRVDSREVYGALVQGASTTMLLDGYDYDRDRQAQRVLKLQSFLEDETQTSLTLSLTNVWSGAITVLVWLASGYCFYKAKK